MSIAFACVSNNDSILSANLLRSPVFFKRDTQIEIVRGAPSASIGYNQALDKTGSELIVFLHHDVFLPDGWDDLLRHRVREVAALDPDWALIGAFGVGLDNREYGPVWSSSLGYIVGRVPAGPVPVQSFDEMLFVMRRGAGLRFDEDLKGFHFYGLDIVQIAASRGLKSYATPLPCVHNDKYKDATDADFGRAYHYMRKKWQSRLPLNAPVVKISWHGLHLTKLNMRNARSTEFRTGMAQPIDVDPRTYASRCGWETLVPRQDERGSASTPVRISKTKGARMSPEHALPTSQGYPG